MSHQGNAVRSSEGPGPAFPNRGVLEAAIPRLQSGQATSRKDRGWIEPDVSGGLGSLF